MAMEDGALYKLFIIVPVDLTVNEANPTIKYNK